MNLRETIIGAHFRDITLWTVISLSNWYNETLCIYLDLYHRKIQDKPVKIDVINCEINCVPDERVGSKSNVEPTLANGNLMLSPCNGGKYFNSLLLDFFFFFWEFSND